MTTTLITALLAGTFGLSGVLGGVLLTNHFTQRAYKQRITSEDERRWFVDRRKVYARYLALITSMLRSLDGTAVFLASEERPAVPTDDEAILKQDVFDFYRQWDDDLQPVLGEVQLLAEPNVAELADRTSWALMELNGFIDSRQPFEMVYEYGFKARHLLDALRNAMRAEIGLTKPVRTFPMPKDWPWLPEEESEVIETSQPPGMESSAADGTV
jgi:hypothetical protein